MSTETTTITIVAIHGNGGGGFRFARVTPYMPDLEAITLPGFADRPPDPSLTSLYDYAAYIRDVITRELDTARPIVLLGTGIGGSMVLEYIQHFADTIDAVILHAPVGTRLDSRRFPQVMQLPGARAFGQWLFSTPLTRPLFKRLLFVDHERIPPEYIKQFFDEYAQCSVFGQMFDLITPEWYAGLEPSPIPAGLLWGEDERVLNVDHVEDYKALLPNHIVRIVPGWDHFPMIEQPQAYANEITTLARNLLDE